MKSKLTALLDTVASMQNKCLNQKNDDQISWVDLQVLRTERNFNRAYTNAKLANQDSTQLLLNYADNAS
jgi:hypothetical protein